MVNINSHRIYKISDSPTKGKLSLPSEQKPKRKPRKQTTDKEKLEKTVDRLEWASKPCLLQGKYSKTYLI